MTVKGDKSMVRRTAQDRTNGGIKLKICGTMLLYFKEGWIFIISIIMHFIPQKSYRDHKRI